MRTQKNDAVFPKFLLQTPQIQSKRKFIFAAVIKLIITPRRCIENHAFSLRNTEFLFHFRGNLIPIVRVQNIIARVTVFQNFVAVIHKGTLKYIGGKTICRNQIIPLSGMFIKKCFVVLTGRSNIIHVKSQLLQWRSMPRFQKYHTPPLRIPRRLTHIENTIAATRSIINIAQTIHLHTRMLTGFCKVF